jgi:hypothetical protein
MTSQSALSIPSFPLQSPTSASNPPTELSYQGRTYTFVDHSANRRRGTKQSPIWKFGHEYQDQSNPNRRLWCCGLCQSSSLFSLAGNTTATSISHLRKKHKMLLQEEDTTSVLENEQTVQALIHSVSIPRFRYHLLRWIVRRHISFTEVEDEDFQSILLELNTAIKPYLISRNTIRNWAENEFLEAQQQIITEILGTAVSRIHVSFDLWTSPNGYALCGIVAHFIGHQYSNQNVLLALKPLTGPHGGEDIADVVIPVLQLYKIVDRLGVFVADNAESNDVAIQAILHQLRPELQPKLRRSRCLGHIINLVAKAFLFGKSVEAFELATGSINEDTAFVDPEAMKKAQKAWREKGAIGKLHNIIVFIRSSPQRREAFKRKITGNDRVDTLMPILDNSTRWNSTYKSLERAILLKERIILFYYEFRAELQADSLSDNDWDHLDNILHGLKPFYQATLRVEGKTESGHHGAIWEALPLLEALLGITERARQHEEANGRGFQPLAVAYQNAWEKLQKYYNKTDEAHSIYAAAVLLHPTYRKQYFDDKWTTPELETWKDIMIMNVKDTWRKDYSGGCEQLQGDPVPSEDILDQYLRKSTSLNSDSFDSFIHGPVVKFNEGADVYAWLKNNCSPSVRQQALDLLSIPTMSAEVERVFSSAKLLITPQRNSLSEERVEYLELLRYWWRNNLISQRR